MQHIRTVVAIAAALFISDAGSFGFAPGVAFAAPGQAICEREMAAAARAYKIPLGVLYAVGLTETGRRNSLSPYALNIEGEPKFPVTARAAEAEVISARARGKKLIDIGCMQINHHFHGEKFRSVSHMLEPRANVRYAARFLNELHARQGTWTMAVARYHAGPNNDPAQKRYVCKVITNMVASGFGQWTPEASKFCKA
ncbi:transglycosylase SLT domain-containing protein [Pannonibacter carbonis]|uniref:transglycosylase SLT domain-containing protein n=1 Tax=Pannonibacter carbonis TaxID=2067569 RepID=UPI001AD93FD1|nr:transglycosylase SLT domain-containing protein [Pannonibacter carbonis]